MAEQHWMAWLHKEVQQMDLHHVERKYICMLKLNTFVASKSLNFADPVHAPEHSHGRQPLSKQGKKPPNLFISICIFIPWSSLLCPGLLALYPATLTAHLGEKEKQKASNNSISAPRRQQCINSTGAYWFAKIQEGQEKTFSFEMKKRR